MTLSQSPVIPKEQGLPVSSGRQAKGVPGEELDRKGQDISSLGHAWPSLGFWPQFMGHKGEDCCRHPFPIGSGVRMKEIE